VGTVKETAEHQPRPQLSRITSSPPAKQKLADALIRLLQDKDFNSITTAEISRTAGANEALIYRYCKDKRGLLHQVLHDYLLEFDSEIQKALQTAQGAVDGLSVLIRSHIGMYDRNRVFARILLLEVRNFPGYFESETYRLVQVYAGMLTHIIEKGIASGEIRDDMPAERIRDLILGGIEHACMAPVIFGRAIDVDTKAEQLGALIFEGIVRRDGNNCACPWLERRGA